jgi:hypothetical protein
MLRADQLTADLLSHLDEKVGQGTYVVVLTSDHGVCPLPEMSSRQGHEAGRVSPKHLVDRANEVLDQAYGSNPGPKQRWVEAATENWLYLNRKLLAEFGVVTADAEATVSRGLANHPGVLGTYSRSQLEKDAAIDDSVGKAVLHSFYPDRSGDVAIVLKPYYVPGEDSVGTTHGSPHSYDTHVPLVVYGAGVRAGSRDDAISPLAVAAILADALHVGHFGSEQAPSPSVFSLPHGMSSLPTPKNSKGNSRADR